MNQHVVIIGAGVVGAATAHNCLKSGLKVTLLDPGTPGQAHAASFGNAGWLSSHSILPPAYPGVWKQIPKWLMDPLGPLTVRWGYLPKAIPWLKDYIASAWTYQQLKQTSIALREMLRDAPYLHKAIATEIGVSDLIVLRNLLHTYPEESDFIADTPAWNIRRDAKVEWVTYKNHELRELEPELSTNYKFGVLVEDTGYCTNPSAYVTAIVDHALKCGATLIQAGAVSLNFRDDLLTSVSTTQGEIECDAAVIAAGARGKALALQAGDTVPLATERGYHFIIQTAGAGPNHPTMFMDRKVIVTPMATGIRIAGQVEIADIDDCPNWQRAEILRQHLAALYPSLAPRIADDQIHIWMGRRPSLPDGLPCIGFASRSRSVIHAYGHGHVGLAGSARTGRVVAQLLTNSPTEINVKPYSPKRFSQNSSNARK